MPKETCRSCHGNGGYGWQCERCGGSGFEPQASRPITKEERIKDFMLVAKGDLERFKTLVTKRFGSSAMQTALNFWSQKIHQSV